MRILSIMRKLRTYFEKRILLGYDPGRVIRCWNFFFPLKFEYFLVTTYIRYYILGRAEGGREEENNLSKDSYSINNLCYIYKIWGIFDNYYKTFMLERFSTIIIIYTRVGPWTLCYIKA